MSGIFAYRGRFICIWSVDPHHKREVEGLTFGFCLGCGLRLMKKVDCENLEETRRIFGEDGCLEQWERGLDKVSDTFCRGGRYTITR